MNPDKDEGTDKDEGLVAKVATPPDAATEEAESAAAVVEPLVPVRPAATALDDQNQLARLLGKSSRRGGRW